MKAVCFGAGNIGRGFLGQLLWESGCEIDFADVDARLIDLLNLRGAYPLRLVDGLGGVNNLTISSVGGILASDFDHVVNAVAKADLILTSVGVGALPHIAPALAAGISARAVSNRPVNILLCENQYHAAELMWGYLSPLLSEKDLAFARQSVGIVDVVVGRMVPKPSAAAIAEDPLLVIAEPYHLLPCDASQLRGDVPAVSGLEAETDFEAYVARKLYLQVAGHAAFAYLGYPKHEFIWQCVEDEQVRELVEPALDEAERAMAARYAFTLEELQSFTAEMLERYRSRALGDTVERVAKDPLRKLRPDDRLVGAANLCIAGGIRPVALARVIAAALRYDDPRDPAALEMQKRIAELGVDGFLESHSKIAKGSELSQLIAAQSI
jgi:mannitol-1-phosphate 5-dehydrogenase